jgi:hypothetical protein
MILNMFRASLCSSSGGQLYIYSTWYRPTLYAAIQSIAATFFDNLLLVILRENLWS